MCSTAVALRLGKAQSPAEPACAAFRFHHRMKLTTAALLALVLTGACADYPKDTTGTSDRVRGGLLRVGFVEGSASDPRLRRFVTQVADRTDGRLLATAGAAEPLLLRLEKGELDLVVGAFDAKSPWTRRVTFSRPIFAREVPGGRVEGKAAVRNGEHAWAMIIDRSVGSLEQGR